MTSFAKPELRNIFHCRLEHCEHIVGAGLADSGRDRRSSDSLRGRRNFVFVFGQVNNARFHRFPVGKNLQHLNTANV